MNICLPTLIAHHNLDFRGVIHVGGHHGQEYREYKSLGIGHIIFVEPLPSNFKILEQSVGPECLLFNTALGNQTGEVEFYVEEANQGMSCSILEPVEHLVKYPHIKFTGKTRVSLMRLDALPFHRDSYNLLTIDVQGYELEVLHGGEETLKGIDCVYTEVNREEVYAGCARIEELDSFLGDRGFTREETRWVGGMWGEAVYLRQA